LYTPTATATTYKTNIKKQCIKDEVDFCLSESQLKIHNTERRQRKDTNDLTRDTVGELEIVKAVKVVAATTSTTLA
jgi:hypothetical protein